MTTMTIKRVGATLTALIIGTLLLANACRAESGSEGKEFYMAFQPNFGGADFFFLFISGERDTQGTVEIAGLKYQAAFTVQANKVTTISIPTAAMLPPNQLSKSTVHVLSQDKVSVYGLNQRGGTTDGFLALPVDALGLEYYALSYPGLYPSQLTLIGAFDGTQVTVTPTAAFGNHPAGPPFALTLNKGDSYMLAASSGDISGTRIVASAPITVMAGADAAYIPSGYSALDHIVEVMPPLSSWGKSFLTVPLATRLRGDLFRVLAAEDGTQVFVNGALVATLQRGKFYETIRSARMQITTSAPALLCQFAVGTSYDNVDGDPFAMIIPPTEQFLDHYTFSTPAGNGFPRQFVNVVMPTAEIGALRLDGAAADPANFSAIGTSGFSGGQLPVGPGTHSLRSVSSVPFGIYVYGFGYHDSYGYAGGMAFKAINPAGDPYPPAIRLVQSGDTVLGSAADSEDLNANGSLDAGEDRNGNGVIDRRNEDLNGNGQLDAGEDANGNGKLDRDTGIFKVELVDASSNLQLQVLPFVPGALAVQFSVTRVDQGKPGIGGVRVEDGAGNRSEMPVSINPVAVLNNLRVVATVNTAGIEVDEGSFRKPPFSVTDGLNTKLIEWRFDTFSADASADLGFDVTFKNPLPGQQRVVTHTLDMYYSGANGQTVHTALGERTVDVFASTYPLTTATDKASYTAGELVRITTLASNIGAAPVVASVRLTVRDGAGALVADLGRLPNQALDAGASVSYAGRDFSSAGVYVGNYLLFAELLDGAGAPLASSARPFAIVAATGPSLKAAVRTDKASYGPEESVMLSARVSNLTDNQAINDLQAVTTVKNADNSVRMTRSETLAQVPAGGNAEFHYSVPLAFALPGQQSATLTVTRASGGAPLDQASTAYTVLSTADSGAGLTGTVTAPAGPANAGQTYPLAFSVSNHGNAGLPNVPISVTIIDPLTQTVVGEYPIAAPLAIGATYQGALNWTAPADAKPSYVAALSASVAATRKPLAQVGFSAVRLEIAQNIVEGNRVLVLVDCSDDENAEPGADGTPGPCVNERATAIARALGALGTPHTIVSDAPSFKQGLRGGQFNTYWLSGKQIKLQDDLASELREAVFLGAGLLTDGPHDERNHVLDEAGGVKYYGKFGETGLAVNLEAPLFGAQRLGSVGRSVRLGLDGAVGGASFDDARANTSGPAVASHAYGAGRSLLYAFDLALSAKADPAWDAALASGLRYVLPSAQNLYTVGSPVTLATSVRSLNQTVSVDLASALPGDARLLAATPAAAIDSVLNTASWRLDAAPATPASVSLSMALGPQAGEASVSTAIGVVTDGVARRYGEPLVFKLTLRSSAQSGALALQALQAYPLATAGERRARDAAVAKVQEAIAKSSLNSIAGYDAAIDALIAAADELRGMSTADTTAARQDIDRMLREAQWRWVQANAARH